MGNETIENERPQRSAESDEGKLRGKALKVRNRSARQLIRSRRGAAARGEGAYATPHVG